MTAIQTPAPDAPGEEWGRLAVRIPYWRWMPGMLGYNDYGGNDRIMDHSEASQINADLRPGPDDPATAGCLLALLGSERHNVTPGSAIAADGRGWWAWVDGEWFEGLTLGRACIAAAGALGRWPGGDS